MNINQIKVGDEFKTTHGSKWIVSTVRADGYFTARSSDGVDHRFTPDGKFEGTHTGAHPYDFEMPWADWEKIEAARKDQEAEAAAKDQAKRAKLEEKARVEQQEAFKKSYDEKTRLGFERQAEREAEKRERRAAAKAIRR